MLSTSTRAASAGAIRAAKYARTILGATGNKKDGPLTADAVRNLEPGILAWLRGEPLHEIERQLGGDPAEKANCPRARELVSQLVPLSLSFAAGLAARTASEIPTVADGTATPVSVIGCLAAGVRRGFDTPSKLAFSDIKRGFLSRVQTHQAYSATIEREPEISNMEEYPVNRRAKLTPYRLPKLTPLRRRDQGLSRRN